MEYHRYHKSIVSQVFIQHLVFLKSNTARSTAPGIAASTSDNGRTRVQNNSPRHLSLAPRRRSSFGDRTHPFWPGVFSFIGRLCDWLGGWRAYLVMDWGIWLGSNWHRGHRMMRSKKRLEVDKAFKTKSTKMTLALLNPFQKYFPPVVSIGYDGSPECLIIEKFWTISSWWFQPNTCMGSSSPIFGVNKKMLYFECSPPWHFKTATLDFMSAWSPQVRVDIQFISRNATGNSQLHTLTGGDLLTFFLT